MEKNNIFKSILLGSKQAKNGIFKSEYMTEVSLNAGLGIQVGFYTNAAVAASGAGSGGALKDPIDFLENSACSALKLKQPRVLERKITVCPRAQPFSCFCNHI